MDTSEPTPTPSSSSSSNWSIKDKTVIITGGTSGIGEFCAQELYSKGAKVHLFIRNLEKGAETVKNIEKIVGTPDNKEKYKISLQKTDLSSLESVRTAAKTFLDSGSPLHCLLNNAGVFDIQTQTKSKDGFEASFAINHLSHFLLTNMLLSRIIESKPSRIVTVSSSRHYSGTLDFNDLQYKTRPYSPKGAYAQSKLANVAFSFELDKRLKAHGDADGVSTYSLHPGVIKSNLFDQQPFYIRFAVNYLIGITVQEGSQTSLHCILDENAGKESGLFYQKQKPVAPNPEGVDPKITSKLWEESEKLVGLVASEPPLVPSEAPTSTAST